MVVRGYLLRTRHLALGSGDRDSRAVREQTQPCGCSGNVGARPLCGCGLFYRQPDVVLSPPVSLPGGASLSFLVLVTGCTSVGRIPEAEIYKITATDFYPLQEEAKEEDRLVALRKILNSGVFYFSWPNDGSSFDLTVRAQKQGHDSYEWGSSFFW